MSTVRLCLLAIFCGFAALSSFAIRDALAQPVDGGASLAAPADSSPHKASPVDSGVPDAMPAPAPAPLVLDELREVQSKYKSLKDNTDKSATMLLWAALLAGVLKVALSAVNLLAGKKPARWLAWIALGLAVPIALLSYYAGGNGLFESLIYAGSGPGAIVVHELLQALKPKAPATADAKVAEAK